MQGTDGDLLLRLAVTAPPVLWFALFGPAQRGRSDGGRGAGCAIPRCW